jgi:hypothetical protein
MSATSFLESSLTRHIVYLQRYAAGINNEQRELFKALAASSRALLNDNLTSFARARLNVNIQQLNALIDETFDVYSERVQAQLSELAEYETGFQYNALQAVMTPTLAAIPVERLEALLTTEKMKLVSGKTIKEFTLAEMFEDFREATKAKSADLIRATIDTGVANGDSADTIARRVARVVGNDIGLPNGTIQTWSKTNVLTAVNHISQQARNEIVRANSEYLEFEKWSSTLDGKTSLICISLDGKTWPVGEGPYPPQHHRERSARLPWIPPEYAIIKKSERASMNGPVDSRTTYGGWLRDQSPEFQDDVLGVERAKLFRSGKVSVDKFTDDSGRTLTLAQLREREGVTLG